MVVSWCFFFCAVNDYSRLHTLPLIRALPNNQKPLDLRYTRYNMNGSLGIPFKLYDVTVLVHET